MLANVFALRSPTVPRPVARQQPRSIGLATDVATRDADRPRSTTVGGDAVDRAIRARRESLPLGPAWQIVALRSLYGA